MGWYYTKLGDSREYGLVEEAELVEMAKTGSLRPDDLVYSEAEETGWVRASGIEGLFPEPDPADAQEQLQVQQAAPVAAEAANAALPVSEIPPAEAIQPPVESTEDDEYEEEILEDRSRAKSAVTAVVLILVFVVFIVARQVVKRGDTKEEVTDEPVVTEEPIVDPGAIEVVEPAQVEPEPEPVEVEPVDEDEWENVLKLIELNIAAQDVNNASYQLKVARESMGDNEKISELDRKLAALKKDLARTDVLNKSLDDGTLGTKGATELVALSAKLEKNDNLKARMRELLNLESLAASQSLCVVRTAKAMGENEVLTEAASVTAQMAAEGDLQVFACCEIATILAESGFGDEARELLTKYLSKDAKSGPAWLELSAIQSAAGEKSSAIKSLYKATRYGGEATKRKAVADKRFDNIRDHYKFKRYTKIK